MRRMEVRCCCTPNKLLGTLPVADAVFRGGVNSVDFILVGVPRLGLPSSMITMEIAEWQCHVSVDEYLADSLFSRPTRVAESGAALKHEGVTIETLRRIPGFIESKT